MSTQFDHNSPESRNRLTEYYKAGEVHRDPFWTPSWGGYVVVGRYADLKRVATDPTTFRSGPGVLIPPIGHRRPLLPMESDGPEHAASRHRLLASFSPRAVAVYTPLIEATLREALGELDARGEVDLYAHVAQVLPARITAHFLGIDLDETAWHWVDTVVYGRLDVDSQTKISHAVEKIYALFDEVLSERHVSASLAEGNERQGSTDLITLLLEPDESGEFLSRQEVLDHCFFLLIAGLENTAFALRAALWHIGTHPTARTALLADPSKVRPFIEECLRMYSPVHGLARTCRHAAEIGGQPVSPGDRVLLAFAGANRDCAVFADPDNFDLGRKGNPHLAFGSGIHRCLGSNLARLELRVAISKILDMYPSYEILPGQDWHPAGPLLARLSRQEVGHAA